MPNHVHLLISIVGERQEQSPCPTTNDGGDNIINLHPTIGDIICVLKSISTKKANQMDETKSRKIWQFRFHDHVIRNHKSYLEIWQYIDTNEAKWKEDKFYIK